MEKEFIKSDNYYVAETMSGFPKVMIDNYVDANDGGFKIETMVDFDYGAVWFTKTICRSLDEDGNEKECPDFEIHEIDYYGKKFNVYKVELLSSEDIPEEELAKYTFESDEQVGGQA